MKTTNDIVSFWSLLIIMNVWSATGEHLFITILFGILALIVLFNPDK